MELASPRVAARESRDSEKFYLGWLLYFLLMIALVGSVAAYGLGTPLFLVGRIFKPARRLGEMILQKGIYLLMALEPWLNAEINLTIPRGALTISNHRSHLDTFLLLSRIPGIRVLAKHTLFFIPFLGFIMWVTRQIPVRRGSVESFWKSMERIRRGIRERDAVHVFPEMTRCPLGFKGTQKFQLAPFHIAFQEKALIVPIAFIGTDNVWRKGRAGLSFRRPVLVQSLEPVDAAQFKNAESLAREVQTRIDEFLASQGT